MHRVLKQLSHSLSWFKVMALQILSNLILTALQLHCSMVQSFVNVLMNVLDGLNRGTHFHIDVSLVAMGEKRVMWHHSTVVELKLSVCNGIGRLCVLMFISLSMIDGIIVDLHCHLVNEVTRIVLGTAIINHAHCL